MVCGLQWVGLCVYVGKAMFRGSSASGIGSSAWCVGYSRWRYVWCVGYNGWGCMSMWVRLCLSSSVCTV